MKLEKRIEGTLKKQLGKRGWDFSDVPDWRQQSKVDLPLPAVVTLLSLGMVMACPTLRDVEKMGEKLGGWLRDVVPEAVSDTTLDRIARRLAPSFLLGRLCQQVRDAYRSKTLNPIGVSAGVAVFDGKNLGTVSHAADGSGHRRCNDNSKWHDPRRRDDEDYYLMPALRVTLSSAAAKPCIYQMAIPAGMGESTAFPDCLRGVDAEYGRTGMIEVVDCDAGLCSLGNANVIDESGYIYVLGLKGNQPDLHEAAQVVLYARMAEYAPDAETYWERRGGKLIRRRLWRSAELQGFETSAGVWSHLQQVWLVRQETRSEDGRTETEDRFFASSAPWHRFSPTEILNMVRLHWAVENDTFNSLDLQWREDWAPWCTRGAAIWNLGLLRIMAYNLVQYLRKRRLCRRHQDGSFPPPRPWREVFGLIRDAITLVRLEADCASAHQT